MRMLAEERKQKTDQLILTSPVSIGGIVVGKYLAMATVFTIPVAVMALFPLILSRYRWAKAIRRCWLIICLV